MSFIRSLKNLVAPICILSTLPLIASDTPPDTNCLFSIDAKVGAYFLLNSTIRDLYGPVLPVFTLEGNVNVYKRLGVWLDGSYIFGNGTYSYGSSHLNFIPISLGLKYVCSIMQSLDLYAGAGPCYSFLITRDRSPYVHEKNHSDNWGFVVKSGFIYHWTTHLQVEGFVDYMYQEFHFSGTGKDPFVYRTNAFLNGIEVGAGVGYNF